MKRQERTGGGRTNIPGTPTGGRPKSQQSSRAPPAAAPGAQVKRVSSIRRPNTSQSSSRLPAVGGGGDGGGESVMSLFPASGRIGGGGDHQNNQLERSASMSALPLSPIPLARPRTAADRGLFGRPASPELRGGGGGEVMSPGFNTGGARARTAGGVGRTTTRLHKHHHRTPREEHVHKHRHHDNTAAVAAAHEAAHENPLIKMLHQTAHDDPEELLHNLQQLKDHEEVVAGKHGDDAGDEDGVNQFSRPARSQEVPLRSGFLDPEANNWPRSQTHSDLRGYMANVNRPHMSYDIDGDGFVSADDYKLAKRFDLDGNGVLDRDEQELGRYMMAREFFRRHGEDIKLFGPMWQGDEAQNINVLATSAVFPKLLSQLRETEKHFRDVGSHGAEACLKTNPKTLGAQSIKHHFYADKFDTTAWNDFGANPRPADLLDQVDLRDDWHDGSRHSMNHLRKIASRDACQRKLDAHDGTRVKASMGRTNFITNPARENDKGPQNKHAQRIFVH